MVHSHSTVPFASVAVGLPSKVRGSEAEEDWQEVDWVTWSTGDLTVDEGSFLLIFKPSDGGSSMKSKPLGSLVKASLVQQGDDRRTLLVTTSDALHRLYRFTFKSGKDAGAFAAMADAAESAANARLEDDVLVADDTLQQSQLEADVRQQLQGRLPLIFRGVELYGKDPHGHANSEVLLGRGLVVLLDPSDDSGCVGSYELIFFGEDDGAQEPVKTFLIDPAMSLKKQDVAREESDSASVLHRLVVLGGAEAYGLAFDAEPVAAAFARDFAVRLRVMKLASKTAKKAHTAGQLRNEIEDVKRKSAVARCMRVMQFCLFVLVVIVLLRLGMLMQERKGRSPKDYMNILLKYVRAVQTWVASESIQASIKVCKSAVGSVPSAEVHRCLALPGGMASIECIRSLSNAP